MLEFGSIVLAAGSILGVSLTAHRVRFGWLWQLGWQVPYLAFDVVTRQYGFIAMSFAFAWLYWHGWQIRGSKNQLAVDLKPECEFCAKWGVECYGSSR